MLTQVEVEAKPLLDTPFEKPQETLIQVKSEAYFDRLAKGVSKLRIRQLATPCLRTDRGAERQTG